MPVEDDAGLRRLLESVNTIAVLGIKAGAQDDAYRVPLYLQRAGHRILPVSPKLTSVLGERCVPRLADLAAPADLIDVFRASQHEPGHVDEILALARNTSIRSAGSVRSASLGTARSPSTRSSFGDTGRMRKPARCR